MASHLIYNINKHSMLPANVTATAIKRKKKGRFGLYYIVELLNSDYTLVGLFSWTQTPCSSCLISTITSLFIT